MTYQTIQRVSVQNLTLFEPMRTDLWATEVGEFSIVTWENGLAGILLLTNMAAAI